MDEKLELGISGLDQKGKQMQMEKVTFQSLHLEIRKMYYVGLRCGNVSPAVLLQVMFIIIGVVPVMNCSYRKKLHYYR